MASKYWIKLYIEILDDPKMGMMADRLFRRTIQLFLLAGDLNGSGELPSIDDMSWRLRLRTEELETDLADLASAGIVHKSDGVWIVTKFEERQAPVSDAERMRRYRERKQKSLYYGYEDVTNRNVDTESDTESDTDSKTETTTSSSRDFGQLTTAYEHNMGVLTPMIGEMLEDDLQTYGLQICLDAILVAVGQNKRKWSYVRGIMKNWWADGRGPGKEKEHEPQQKKVVLPSGEITEVTV
jgi:DnaD/phage-associated family protein